MGDPLIRPKAVAICRDGDRVLVERGHDRVLDRRFYLAIGGAIEFGERAAETVAREWLEELGLRIDGLRLLGVLENLFTFEGCPGHEIVFVYLAQLVDASAAAASDFTAVESSGQIHVATWVPIIDLERGDMPLYPDGMLRLLRASQ